MYIAILDCSLGTGVPGGAHIAGRITIAPKPELKHFWVSSQWYLQYKVGWFEGVFFLGQMRRFAVACCTPLLRERVHGSRSFNIPAGPFLRRRLPAGE